MSLSPVRFFSEQRVMEDIAAISALTRWMTTPKINAAARYMVDRLKETPAITDVDLHEFPADGRTFYGGWVMPKGWDVSSATLSVVGDSGGCPRVLADWQENSWSLMMWSPATPPEGIEADVVVVEDGLNPPPSVRGKFALIGNLGQIGVRALAAVAAQGAVGLISDRVITFPGIKDGPELEHAIQYWNYTNPQWDHAQRLPAFGLTPALGKKLRALIAARGSVRLHAKVDARLYDGTLPVVMARLPGRHFEEIVLTAHMDEPGASDNTSGTALAMELMRIMARHVAETGQKFHHGIRLISSVESRGLQALLNTKKFTRGVVASLNLDMLACDPEYGRTQLDILSARPTTPSALDFILRELVQKEASTAPKFRTTFKRTVVVNDCHFASLPYAAPTALVEQAPDRTYHSSLDTMENLSATHVKRLGRILGECLTTLAAAEYKTFSAIAKRVLNASLKELRAKERSPYAVADEAKRAWADLIRMLPEHSFPYSSVEARNSRRAQLIKGVYGPRAALEVQAAEWQRALQKALPKKPAQPPASSRLSKAMKKRLTEIVPLKLFAGYLAFEDLTPEQEKELTRTTGIVPGWGAPGWVQWAIDLANGKRTLLQVYETISPDAKLDAEKLIAAFDFLRDTSKLRYRPYVSQKTVLEAIRSVGIRAGDIVMTHSSLSDFGYIEGGADGLIDVLLKAVGKRGTVCVPTHSLNWVGRAPYDPKTSPSFTGVIPATFLKRKGALRSAHPTHSVAAIGPHAAALFRGEGPHNAPQDRNGFWGKFVEANGKVLMLCKLGSNTLLHAGEIWAGTPYPPGVTHSMVKGKRVETVTPGMPWHVHTFDAVHAALEKRGQLFSAPLGESKIYSMNARTAVDEMIKLVQADPMAPIRENCPCEYCNYLRKHIRAGNETPPPPAVLQMRRCTG